MQSTAAVTASHAPSHSVRQIVETVNDQLTEQFHIETNHAHTFWGLCTRLYAKLTAHTLCIYINRQLGKPISCKSSRWPSLSISRLPTSTGITVSIVIV